MKNIGDKRKERAKKSRKKILKVREITRTEAKKKKQTEDLLHKTRERQNPIVNHIENDVLLRNFNVLKQMEEEMQPKEKHDQ